MPADAPGQALGDAKAAACERVCATSCSNPAPADASACRSTCRPSTGSAACANGWIAKDPVESLAARTGPRPQDRGLLDLEPLIEPVRATLRVPGLAAALVRNGHLEAMGTAGVRRVGSSERLELDDPFHLGSCGKAFTATLAAILVERGMVRWETAIGETFPELSPTTHSKYADVSLRQLLAHRGGFASRDATFDGVVAGVAGRLPEQRFALVRYATATAPARDPGTGFVYSDIGYSVAGVMLARAAQRSWEELVQGMLAEPLGLTTLGFGAPGERNPDAVPRGHVLDGENLVALGVGPGADLAHPAIGPAGTLHMSLGDWARFASLHLEGARGEDSELLSTSGFRALHEDAFDQGYGLGWFVTRSPWGEGRALTHTGSCGAWSALIWILPEQNAAILVASNVGGGSGFGALQLAADKIGERYLSR